MIYFASFRPSITKAVSTSNPSAGRHVARLDAAASYLQEIRTVPHHGSLTGVIEHSCHDGMVFGGHRGCVNRGFLYLEVKQKEIIESTALVVLTL